MAEETGKVTRHQTAPEELQVSEIRYRRLFESARDGILILDTASRRITDANPFMVEFLGYSRDEFLGKELWEIGLFKDKYESQAAFRELQETGYIRYEDLPLQTKAGKPWHVEFISNVYREGGRSVIQCNIRDITERKNAEERLKQSELWLRTIFEASHEGILVEENERIHYVNKSYLRLFGYDDADELIGQHISAVISPEDAERLLGYGRSRLRGEQPPSEYEFKGKRKDGSTVEVEASASASLIEDGIYITTMIRDITGRKRAEAALRDAQERITNIFESITDCFYALDADWRFTYVNPQAEEYFNRPKEQLLGRVYVEAFPLTRGSEVLARLQEAMSEQKPSQFEIISPTTGKWVDMHVFPADGGLGVYFRDITERHRTEEALRESEMRFRAMFEQANVGIVQASFDGILLKVNPGFCKIVGYPEGEVIGMAIRDLTHPDDYEEEEALTRLLMAGGIPGYSIEKQYLRKDGRLVWGQMTATLVSSSSGEPFYMLAIVEDISERKRAEEALRRSENRYRALVEQAADGIHTYDACGNFIEVNSKLCEMLGYTREELLRLNVRDLVPPEDLAADPIRFDKLLSGEKLLKERRLLRKDGTLIPVEISGAMIQGGPLQAIIRDITERKRAEEALLKAHEELEERVEERTAELSLMNAMLVDEVGRRERSEQSLRESEARFRGAFENATIGLYRTTPEGRILLANQTLMRMLGYPSFEELARVDLEGEGRHSLYPRSEFRERIERDGEIRGLEAEWRRADGSLISVCESAKAYRTDDGSVLYYEGTVEDISERKRTEEALTAVRGRLLTAQEDERRRLALELHDEAGQSLTAIAMCMQRLENGLSGGRVDGAHAAEELARLRAIVGSTQNDLRRMAHSLHPSTLEYFGLQKALCGLLEGAGADALNWTVVFPEDFPRLPAATEGAIFRILQEAINNVLKHAQARSVSLRAAADVGEVSLVLADDGRGFDAEDLVALRGLGLVSVRERADIIGAKVSLSSRLGGGTTLTLRVPL